VKHLNEEQLQAYGGNMSADEHASLERHLDQCPTCRRQLSAYAYVDKTIGAGPERGFSEDFEIAVMARVSELGARPKPVSDYIVLVAAIAGIAAVIALWVFSPQLRDPLSQSVQQAWQIVMTHLGSDSPSGEWLKAGLLSLIIMLGFTVLDRLTVRRRTSIPSHPHR
jgi:hypothetical protein